jgi:nitrogenase molybdenum-cofactor synthesis protein NifE
MHVGSVKGSGDGYSWLKIQQVLNEPGCATNQAKPSFDRKKGCNRLLAPGAAAGGCAFDGAKIALQPITDVCI